MSALDSVHRDVRYSFRILRKSPGFTTVAVLTLALALGANTAVFSVMHGVLLRALPYEEPARLYDVGVQMPPQEGRPGGRSYLDTVTFETWRETSRTVEVMAAYRPQTFTLTGQGAPVRLQGATVSTDLLSLLGVQPWKGRGFRPEEAGSGGEPGVVLSYELWEQRFQGDSGALGRPLTLDGTVHTVIGVMPKRFFFPNHETELWVPFARTPEPSSPETVHVSYLPAVVRLPDGMSPEQAAREAEGILHGGRSPNAETPADRVELTPLREAMVSEARPALVAMLAAVGLVLLIACANLAHLLLARNASREREMAVRLAVGGDRTQLIRQILTESVILSACGGGVGLLVTLVLHRFLPYVVAADLPRIEDVRVDFRVFLFAFLLVGLTGILVGLLPALRSAKTNLVRSLHGGSPRVSRGLGSRGLLVVGETALAFVLLVGAGLLLSSYLALVGVDPGFDSHRVLTVRLESSATEDFFAPLLERLEDHPQVEAAGTVSVLPPARGFSLTSFDIPDLPPARTLAVPQWVSPGYFEAMGMRWLEGRGPTAEEFRRHAPVVVVNEALVRKFFAGAPASQRRIVIGSTSLEIVGVVEDVRLLGLDAEPRPEIYASFHLAEPLTGAPPSELSLAIKTLGSPEALIPFLRAAVWEIDPTIPLDELQTLESRLSASVAQPRLYASLLGGFAALALLMCAAGIFGVLAAFVARRTRKIGIQRALGAQRGDILKMVLGRGVGLTLLGLGVGLGAAWAGTRLLSHLLFQVTALDAPTYAAAAVVLTIVALVACYVPARRALRVDPMVVLRQE